MSDDLHRNPEYPEDIPYRRVLDHGFVALIDVMGEDASIVQAARVSYGKGTKTVRGDKALISYLMRHRHCYDARTEVLTDAGFVRWPDVDGSERLGVWDPERGSLSYEQPAYVTRHAYEGPMLRVDEDGVDLLVTPDHRMYVRPEGERAFRLVPASELSGTTAAYRRTAPLRAEPWRGGDYPRFADSAAALRLTGLFLVCGEVFDDDTLLYRLRDPERIGFLGSNVARARWGLAYAGMSSDAGKFLVRARGVGRLFRQTFLADDRRRLPPWALSLDRREARELLAGVRGSELPDDRALRDQVQILALHAGVVLDLSGSPWFAAREEAEVRGARSVPYEGRVYCAHTRTGVLVVRRNGRVVLSGNTTPFEMVEFKFLMRLPLFIARQVIRHRTASVNEYSARYSVVPDRFWVPSLGAIADQDTVNRQGRIDAVRELAELLPVRDGDAVRCAFLPDYPAVLVADDGTAISREALSEERHRDAFIPHWSRGERDPADMLATERYAFWVEELIEHFPERKRRLEEVRARYRAQNESSYALYKELLDQGIAREIARCVLPLSMYTEWYWKIDLHNLFHFLSLRMDAHAQFEVRAFAEAMATFVKPRVPFAWEAFEHDRVRGTFLSAAEREVLRPADPDTQRAVLEALHERGYRRRRLKEVCRKLGIDERLVDELWPPKRKQG